MQVTVENINGVPHTVLWHDEAEAGKWRGDYRQLQAGLVLHNPFNRNHHIATALPPLPRKPTAS